VNLERPAVVRAVMAAAAVLLVLGLIGVFTVDADDNTDLAASDRTTTTGDTGTTTTLVGIAPLLGRVTTTVAGTATTKPATTSTSSNAPVPDPGPVRAPNPGTYTYNFASQADPSTNGETESKIEVLPPLNGAARRRQTYKDGEGNTLANEETWDNGGLSVTTSHIVSPQATVDCTWKPPLLVLGFPLAIGKTFTTDSTCTTMVQGTQVTLHRQAEGKVTGKFLEKIGGTSVAVWVIESTGTTTVKSAFFNTETTEKITRRFAPGRGLITYEKGDISANGRTSSYDRTLVSLTAK